MEEKRITLKDGIAWVRWLIVPIALGFLMSAFSEGGHTSRDLFIVFICYLLFILIKKSRKIQYDSESLYIIHGKKEKIIQFANIISIKKSNTKINGKRFWKLTYDIDDKKQTCRYFADLFDLDAKKMNEKIRKINPNVIIWYHPYFH